MSYSQIKARVKLLNDKTRETINSPSYARVVGVLSGLGFIIAPDIKPLPTSKIEFEEALKIGISVEPRVIEVLPAAVLSFPKSFLHLEKAPPIFKEIVQALKKGIIGPDYQGVKFQKFLEAANRQIKNRKRKPLSERRIPKTFRFTPATVQFIAKRASELNLNQTTYIEKLINMDS